VNDDLKIQKIITSNRTGSNSKFACQDASVSDPCTSEKKNLPEDYSHKDDTNNKLITIKLEVSLSIVMTGPMGIIFCKLECDLWITV
jgi:hypothetical protein